jgi:hypothetical protein
MKKFFQNFFLIALLAIGLSILGLVLIQEPLMPRPSVVATPLNSTGPRHVVHVEYPYWSDDLLDPSNVTPTGLHMVFQDPIGTYFVSLDLEKRDGDGLFLVVNNARAQKVDYFPVTFQDSINSYQEWSLNLPEGVVIVNRVPVSGGKVGYYLIFYPVGP